MVRSCVTLVLAGWLIACGLDAHAATVLIPAESDNTLYEDPDGAFSNGAGQHFFAGLTGAGVKRRAVLRFALAGSLPPDVTIHAVELRLNASQVTLGARPVSLHRALAAWGEGTSDATGNEGAGATSTAGDATWIHAFYPGTLWAALGGDFEAAASATTLVDGLGPYAWLSTPALVNDARLWQTSPGLNYGWVLVGDETAASTAKRFDSSENPNPLVWPVLVVEYEVTVPVEATTWGRVKAATR